MAKHKTRYFTFLIYPESSPENWMEQLELLGVPMAISPLHDKDLSEVEGQRYKKPHWHVIYIANNPVTADSVRKKIRNLLGNESVAMVQPIITSVENAYLYLTHESKDAKAKKKHMYDKKDIMLLNNFDIDRYIVVDAEEKKRVYQLVLRLTYEYGFRNIIDLSDFVLREGENYGLPSMEYVNDCISSNSASLLRLYFDGNYQRSKEMGERKRD